MLNLQVRFAAVAGPCNGKTEAKSQDTALNKKDTSDKKFSNVLLTGLKVTKARVSVRVYKTLKNFEYTIFTTVDIYF